MTLSIYYSVCEYLSKIKLMNIAHSYFQLQIVYFKAKQLSGRPWATIKISMIQGAMCGGLNSLFSYACSLCVFVERWVTS